jgi:Leucine-rich repeat (LRR) protein
MADLLLATLKIVAVCGHAKDNVKQNRKKSERLLEALEAIDPPLRVLAKAHDSVIAHEATLRKLCAVVERAQALLTRQHKKSYLNQITGHASVEREFADITDGLQTHMAALNLSVAVLDRMTADVREMDAKEDVAELQDMLRSMRGGQDDLREQLEAVEEGQVERARELIAALGDGNAKMNKNIQRIMNELVESGRLQMAARSGMRSALVAISMESDLVASDDYAGMALLGVGGFGQVRRMRWLSGGVDVAVKTLLHTALSDKAMLELRREAEAMAVMPHPNVTRLFGASLTPPHLCLVLEFATGGSLDKALAREGAPPPMPGASGADAVDASRSLVVWRERLSITVDTARGLSYLHSRRVLHRDIKSANVLLFGVPPRRLAKIADFGLAVVKSESGTLATVSSAGTVNWKAPELLKKGGISSRASDMYSFACVVYELASGRFPWTGQQPFEIFAALFQSERPDRPQNCPDDVWALVQRGWAQDPEARVSFTDAIAALEDSAKTVDRALAGLVNETAPVDALAIFMAELAMEAFTAKLRDFGVGEPGDLADVEDTELGDIGVKPLKVRQLRRALSSMLRGGGGGGDSVDDDGTPGGGVSTAGSPEGDEAVLRAWQAECPAVQELWDDDDAVSMWRGITIAAVDDVNAGRVVKIRLEYLNKNKLTSLPVELGNLSSLSELHLSGNQLTSVPVELGNLSSLSSLHLGGNRLTSVPAELGNLSSLSSLYLYENQLTSVPVELGNLSSLSELILNRNQLTSVPVELGNLSSLSRLDLGENQLTSVPAELGNLSSLSELCLYKNQLTSVPAELGNLSSLYLLKIDGNQLTSVPVELGNLRSLEGLLLEMNQLTSVPAELGNLSSLSELYLGGNRLTSVPAELGNLSSLSVLQLCSNQLSSVPVELGNLSTLSELYLDNNQLTSVPVELGNLSSLSSLHLYENQLTSVPAELGNLSSLSELHLHGNQLTSVPLELGNLSSLSELRLNENQLTSVPVELGNLSSLSRLYLHGNQLTSVPLELGNLSSLSKLRLNENQLTSVPVELLNLRSLRWLHLDGNQLTSVPAAWRGW